MVFKKKKKKKKKKKTFILYLKNNRIDCFTATISKALNEELINMGLPVKFEVYDLELPSLADTLAPNYKGGLELKPSYTADDDCLHLAFEWRLDNACKLRLVLPGNIKLNARITQFKMSGNVALGFFAPVTSVAWFCFEKPPLVKKLSFCIVHGD